MPPNHDSSPCSENTRFTVDVGHAGLIDGTVHPGYERVADAFVGNFTSRSDTGAALCIYRHGRPVVDLWGGWADPKRRLPYTASTLQLVFSTTKGLTTLCLLQLVDQGRIQLDTPVADVWPEFAAAGKQDIPVRWLLTHRAALPTVDNPPPLAEVLAGDPIVDALAAQAPYWEPGTAHGYHALTYGWLLGEVVRRVTGQSLGQYFAEQIAGPLGLDTWIGLPEEEETRVAPLRLRPIPSAADLLPRAREVLLGMLTPESFLLRALTLSGVFGVVVGRKGGPFNSRAVHRAEVPAANGITNARSLARVYAAAIGEVDGRRMLSASLLDDARTPQVQGPDRVLVVPTTFGLGFMCHSPYLPLLGPGSFGHPGMGGSLGFADPDTGIAFGYVMNQLRLGLSGDERTTKLIEALQAVLA
jgi:CubicO group peptidase (beta-lactamase class C family)